MPLVVPGWAWPRLILLPFPSSIAPLMPTRGFAGFDMHLTVDLARPRVLRQVDHLESLSSLFPSFHHSTAAFPGYLL